jgi:hypothetical protein
MRLSYLIRVKLDNNKFLLSLAVISLTFFLLGYGYTREEDPLLKGVKLAILHAKQDQWDKVKEDIDKLSWQVEELREDIKVDIGPLLHKVVASQQLPELGKGLLNLVYLALIQKFFWNQKEGLTRYIPAKARLYSAEIYYQEILAPTVRQYDARMGKNFHREITDRFKFLPKTLGSPGLFGIGAKSPDLQTFSQLAQEIEERLQKIFSHFLMPR